MERDKLKLIVKNLRLLVDALESEVYSDTDSYTTKQENFDDPSYQLHFRLRRSF